MFPKIESGTLEIRLAHMEVSHNLVQSDHHHISENLIRFTVFCLNLIFETHLLYIEACYILPNLVDYLNYFRVDRKHSHKIRVDLREIAFELTAHFLQPKHTTVLCK